MREHELRRHIVGEMHLRRWPQLSAPMRIVQLLQLVDSGMRDAEFAAVLAPPAGGVVDQAGARHVSGTLSPGIAFGWERHNEASSITLFAKDADSAALARAVEWAETLPGTTLRATQITLVRDDEEAQRLLPSFAFEEEELVTCHVAGDVRIWSDFRIGGEGYGRTLIAANGAAEGDLTRTVQRVQELGNYRNLALLGLPIAQACWPLLDKAEAHLRQIGENLVKTDVRDDELMDQITSLSMEIAAIASSANYRMSATAAYGQLTDERINDLKPESIRGYPSLVDFTQRRLHPAVRTCAAFTRREQQVATRAGQLTGLLRTRIETRIENQNAQLLASMERSSSLQLRLQHMVEGLSVVAISYYALSLLSHMLEGLAEFVPAVHPHAVVAVLTLPAVLCTGLVLRHMRKRLVGDH